MIRKVHGNPVHTEAKRMTIEVIGRSLMLSDLTRHQARTAGGGRWVISYLPGRTLSTEHSVAALLVAEEVAPVAGAIGELATDLGLSPMQVVAMAATECSWRGSGQIEGESAEPIQSRRPRTHRLLSTHGLAWVTRRALGLPQETTNGSDPR